MFASDKNYLIVAPAAPVCRKVENPILSKKLSNSGSI